MLHESRLLHQSLTITLTHTTHLDIVTADTATKGHIKNASDYCANRLLNLVVLAITGQTNSATTLDLFLSNSGDRRAILTGAL